MNIQGKMLENRYEILEKIGVGGMATVYRAKCHVLNRDVAIKVLKDEFTTDSEFITRFNAEAQSAASLTHPNIVSVYDVGQSDDMYYIVMELIKGKTLKEIISDEGRIPWKWSLNIAKQIASALEIAHKNGIVHRDIKPHNIIITEDGIAKVTDFGIAKAVTTATMTSYGNTLGSVHYFSPEHARGATTDAKTDIYSLGIVMYEMVTGRVPFDADTPVSVALKQVQEKPIEPISINPEIPEGLNYIILKAMEKDKNLRYNSARELLQDLDILAKNPEVDFNSLEESIKKQVTTFIPKQDIKEEKLMDKPAVKYGLMAGGIVIAILLVMFITMAILKAQRGKEAFIPNLTGEFGEKRKTKQEAEEELKKLGFEFEETEEFSDDIEKDLVLRQDPKYQPNYKIKTNTKIKIAISKGTEMVKVPDEIKDKSQAELKKKTVDEIKSILDKAGLKYEEVEEFSESIEAGKLIDLKLPGVKDGEIAKKEKIQIIKSKGSSRKEVTVPDLNGKSKEEARKELEKLGLSVKEESATVDYLSNGVITATEPTAGTKMREKDTIIMFVNKVQEIKKGKLNVNVFNLGNFIDNDILDKKKVKVKIELDDKKIEDSEILLSKTPLSLEISSLGRSRLNVYINGTLKYDNYIDLNQKTNFDI